MEPADVTLVIPCYNVVETLGRVLESVDRLDPAPQRVICVDDGSTDGTKRIVQRHDGVELVEHEFNRGLGATLNTALLWTTTPGLAKIDGDIVVEPDWLGRLCAIRDEHDADLVQGRFEEEVTTVADRWREKHLQPGFLDESVYNKPINGSNILCRTDALRAVGGWDERYTRTFDDIDLAQRLITAGYRVYYTPDVVTTHLRTDTREDVLHAAWAYHYGSFGSDDGRLPPESIREAVLRLPEMAARSVVSINRDLRDRAPELLSISLQRPLSHLRYDLESIKNGGSSEEDCLARNEIEYGDVTVALDDDVITPWIKRQFCRGRYEWEETEMVLKYLDAGTDVVELGGGVGYLSSLIDGQISADRKQVVVEPNERLLPLIERNRAQNEATFEIVHAAYSPDEAHVMLEIPEQFWMASVSERENGAETQSVPAADLSTLLDQYDLSTVSLVVDIEGSEIELIERELDVLESTCELLIIEFHPDRTGQEAVERAKRRLESASFERIDQEGPVHTYRP